MLELTAKVEDATYFSQKIWVDAERFFPLKEELYAKGGQLLKRITQSDIRQIQRRWFPMSAVYKAMLKEGSGTEFKMTSVKFDQVIPDY